MRRREFIAGLGAAAWPVVAHAQQQPMPVIGYLATGSPDIFASRLAALRQGIGEHGYFEGRNVAIEYRWASGLYDQLQAFATGLVAIESMSLFPWDRRLCVRLLRRRPLFLLSS
jgi:putative ABC transport system substrate-binding protein